MTHTVIEAVSALIAFAWLYKFLECAVGLRKVPDLTSMTEPSASGTDSVVVIVPARNEQRSVRSCIDSLIQQTYPCLHVIAIDDRSEDGTGVILTELALRYEGRLTVIQVDQLPSNWLGKSHAMALGAKIACERGPVDWLLFTDADIVFDPVVIARSVNLANRTHADHLVVMPTTIAKSWGEAMVLSFMHVMSLWALRPWKVPDPKAKKDSIGVGAFNLIRQSAYRMIGGFEAFPMEILEDLRLGREVKAAGMHQEVATAAGMVNVHWAPGIQGIVRGITKNLFAVFNFRGLWLTLAAVWIGLFCVVGPLSLLFQRTRWQGAITLFSAFGLYRLSSRTSRIPALFSLVIPVSAIIVVYAMLRSMVLTKLRGGVEWRGTFYDLGTLRRFRRM